MVDYSDINRDIIKLWKDFPNDRGNRIPFLFPPSEDGCLLFIGFNPSFPPAHANRVWPHPYDIARLDDINEDQIILQERQTQSFLPYFKPLKAIAAELQLLWSHLDVFMLRETSQKQARKAVYPVNGLTPFGKKQFALFTKALQKSTPRIIVVINALASQIIEAHLPLEYNCVDGCYYASENMNIQAPFFLGSMLTGQRALDVFNRKRLNWHINTKL